MKLLSCSLILVLFFNGCMEKNTFEEASKDAAVLEHDKTIDHENADAPKKPEKPKKTVKERMSSSWNSFTDRFRSKKGKKAAKIARDKKKAQAEADSAQLHDDS